MSVMAVSAIVVVLLDEALWLPMPWRKFVVPMVWVLPNERTDWALVV